MRRDGASRRIRDWGTGWGRALLLCSSLLFLGAGNEHRSSLLEDVRDVDHLRRLFQEHQGKPRIVLLLSPSCGHCRAGAQWVDRAILDAMPETEVTIFAIWFEVVREDKRSSWPRDILKDPRVVHLWDRDREIARWYHQKVTDRRRYGFEWDSWFLYGSESTWSEGRRPTHWVTWGSTIAETIDTLAFRLEMEAGSIPLDPPD